MSQPVYWQQQVDYKISVTLNDADNTLDGNVVMLYQNNSPDTLHFIWFHLWPNAYKNDRTAFSDQLLENGRTDFYFSNEENHGYINRLDFKSANISLATEDHPQHQDMIRIILSSPLAPGQKINIETPFHVKLPYNFSRSGFIDKSYQVAQWYPKPAVYDRKGWHPMPYLDQGEFYSEFGNYEVSITVPKKYVIASTGVLKKTTETDITKTLIYSQENIHDFAWFADKDFTIEHDTLTLQTKTIDVFTYYNPANKEHWMNSIKYIKKAILSKSHLLGEYPYNVVSVVEKPANNQIGGMEYPTITLITSSENEKFMEYLIHHEVGHNWFYGILATNERIHPWMDEGMNSYYDRRYFMDQYGSSSTDFMLAKSSFINNRKPEDPEGLLLRTLISERKDQPIETQSGDFTNRNYEGVAYYKTGQWLKHMEEEFGEQLFDSIMRTYYTRWKFKHPYPEDFRAVAEDVSDRDLSQIFSLKDKKGSILLPVAKGLKITSFFSLKETGNYNYIFAAPALGYNFYDKLMLGVIVHNYTLPLNKFQFFVAPLYSTGSRELNGIGRISYSWYTGKSAKLEASIAGAKFSVDSYTDSTNTKNYLQFSKIVPSFKYTFSNKRARSTVSKYIQLKTFMINETGLLFSRDTMQQTDVISYPENYRYVNQFKLVIENKRILYPFRIVLQADQGDGFIRTDITANYYFNYSKGGGLNVRLYGGKFIYTADRTFIRQFQTDRYHLNLSGAKGKEDYTYSNYFAGRNEFEGLSSQQLMIRDGGFKVRTDLLSSKIGKTDDWLSAINFSTTIPKQFNPLELLPIKIPLKLFADVGTYADAWKKNSTTSRFLYDAGLQFSLFKEIINIYVPLLYSKVYADYFKSTITEKRFQKNISFSIDLQNISLQKLFPQIYY